MCFPLIFSVSNDLCIIYSEPIDSEAERIGHRQFSIKSWNKKIMKATVNEM